ncbi:hypothetical protein CONPUDRAFT_167326 [Coniophora puteana RWD-64-598 SS2]|uniref:MYND-type domain-containing protein n=1 Tax=Coniophora puteana (strain RWD-64-598) TaxID=741705 RepID=A0A5M3MH02_CONPW|nr:uncharacterized protein CONPUDRAFT_167326 [Coniophora puteana RWD-64-598 SS2]EIW78286.1 hypothetical protein CONPUDRAFT_167326 [Coniophora puteana RWD-64-598 SS2]
MAKGSFTLSPELILEPKPYLDAIPIPAGFQLPSLLLVREDAITAAKWIMNPDLIDTKNVPGIRPDGTPLGDMHPGLVYQAQLKLLFQFAYFCQHDTVPYDILPQCVWALQWFARAAEEAPEDQLRALGHILPHQRGAMAETARHMLVINSQFKLTKHLMSALVDRPKEAVKYFHKIIDIQTERIGPKTKSDDMLTHNPNMYAEFGTALARTREDDEEAERVLRRTLVAFDKPKNKAPDQLYAIKCRVYLSRVLRRRGAESEAEAEKLEAFVAKWLKKNHSRFPVSELRDLFGTSDTDPETDPILIATGGMEVLTRRGLSYNAQQRRSRVCRHCNKAELAVKLFQCVKCKHTFYCSRECQKENWRLHKEFCKDQAASLMRADLLKALGDTAGSQLLTDWTNWRNMIFPDEMLHARVHALNLQRDHNRGRTHLLITEVREIASAKHPAGRFRAVRTGVFRLVDVKRDIELVMGLDKGECDEMVREMFEEFDQRGGEAQYPWLELYFGDDKRIQTYLSISGISDEQLEKLPHNPDWRKQVNYKGGDPPLPISALRSGAKDAEHDL